jgi:hypothetical protein
VNGRSEASISAYSRCTGSSCAAAIRAISVSTTACVGCSALCASSIVRPAYIMTLDTRDWIASGLQRESRSRAADTYSHLLWHKQANLHHALLGQHGGLETQVALEQLALVLQLSLLHLALDQRLRQLA